MDSIAENDFFSGEPIIVIPDINNDFVVVEGNRRLVAVILINNPDKSSQPSLRMRDISAKARYKPKKLPAVKRHSLEEVVRYLGYSHITGVREWGPLAKARYMKKLFDRTPIENTPDQRYSKVARSVGSRVDYIKNSLDALAIYNIIEANRFFDIDGLSEETIKFSILSIALSYKGIGSFIGLVVKNAEGDYDSYHPIIDPSVVKVHEINELTEWLYKKDDDGKVRIGESRRLKELSAVVKNQSALSAFRDGATLTYAYQLTSDICKDFLGLLYQAEGALTEAAGIVATMDYDEQSIQVSRRILETIKLIGKTLREKRKPDDDDFA